MMFSAFPFWYSDVLEFYNSANLALPEAETQIAEELNLKTDGSHYVLSRPDYGFLLHAKIRFNIDFQPYLFIVNYRFSLINPWFVALILSLLALYFGISNYKMTSWLLLLAALLTFVLLVSLQNSFVRRKIADALCLPYFEGDAQTLHNQLVDMNNTDKCPACGAQRKQGDAFCQNCGTKLPS